RFRLPGVPVCRPFHEEREMLTRVGLGIALLLALGAAGARAAADDAESGIPDSVEYAQRSAVKSSPSNEEIGALEIGNPDSVDYANRMSPVGTVAWQVIEAGNPDF